MSAKRLEDKIAIVTGGAQGIGRAIVHKFCEEGAHVIYLDRDGARGAATAEELNHRFAGRPPRFLECDITIAADIERAIGRVMDAHGRVDVLVNNAGVTAYFDAAEMTEAQWDSVFAID